MVDDTGAHEKLITPHVSQPRAFATLGLQVLLQQLGDQILFYTRAFDGLPIKNGLRTLTNKVQLFLFAEPVITLSHADERGAVFADPERPTVRRLRRNNAGNHGCAVDGLPFHGAELDGRDNSFTGLACQSLSAGGWVIHSRYLDTLGRFGYAKQNSAAFRHVGKGTQRLIQCVW